VQGCCNVGPGEIGKPSCIGDRRHQKRQRGQREDRIFRFQEPGESIAGRNATFRNRGEHVGRSNALGGIEARPDQQFSRA